MYFPIPGWQINLRKRKPLKTIGVMDLDDYFEYEREKAITNINTQLFSFEKDLNFAKNSKFSDNNFKFAKKN